MTARYRVPGLLRYMLFVIGLLPCLVGPGTAGAAPGERIPAATSASAKGAALTGAKTPAPAPPRPRFWETRTIADLVRHGDVTRKEIALTFDDGPKPRYTTQLLTLLRQSGVKATFFLVGERALRYPDIVQTIVTDGHSIGNHTFNHPSLSRSTTQQISAEIMECGDAIESITGQVPRYFRPPGGDIDSRVYQVARAAGYVVAMWDVAPRDCNCDDAAVIKSRVISQVGNGSIILLHVGLPQTLEALPGIITTLKSQGYQFVTLDAMFTRRDAITVKPADTKKPAAIPAPKAQKPI